MWVVVHINVFDGEASSPQGRASAGWMAGPWYVVEWRMQRRGLAGPPLQSHGTYLPRRVPGYMGTTVQRYNGTSPPCTSPKYLNAKSGLWTGLFLRGGHTSLRVGICGGTGIYRAGRSLKQPQLLAETGT